MMGNIIKNMNVEKDPPTTEPTGTYNQWLDLDNLYRYCRENIPESKIPEFDSSVLDILNKWKEVTPNTIVLGKKRTPSPERQYLVHLFVYRCMDFVPLNMIPEQTHDYSVSCSMCGEDLIQEETVLVCRSCNLYQESYDNKIQYSDRVRINTSNVNNYENIETFRKTLEHYQGKETYDFEGEFPGIFQHMEEWCKNNDIEKSEVNPDIVRKAFSDMRAYKYNTLYKHANLFTHLFNDYQLPDLGIYESLIIEDYHKFQSKYPEYKGSNRESSLNACYILYILLRRRGIQLDMKNLKLPRTKKILENADYISKKIFDSLGWTFESVV